jgi:VWFA-related protein
MLVAGVHLSGQQTTTPQKPAPVFRSAADLVRVDVVVRDKNGNVVKGLTAADFVVLEDGKPQQITSFNFEEIATEALPAMTPAPSVFGLEQLQSAAARRTVVVAPTTPANTPQPEQPAVAMQDLPGRRMIVLLFDTSSMQPEEVDRAVKSAGEYIDRQMTPADLVALASVGQTLTILREFTADRDVLKSTLGAFDATSGTGFEQPVAADTADVTADTDPADLPLDDSEFGIFNNDRRLRAMRVLCEALAPIEQKKALLYFSAGMSRSGSDNEVELRAVTNTCNKANTSIYPVDSRGLTAVVPGGGGGRGGGGGGRGGGAGSSVFSGRAMVSQFASLNSSQETLTTLAADTGGQAFIDSNDFAPAFTRVQRDMSAYYLLGYGSSNTTKDGKFRKITVRLKNTSGGYKVEARTGYYANADFAHLGKNDRERQLQEQIASAVSATDLPVVAATSWFRVANDRFYVPVSVAIPGSAVPLPAGVTAPAANAPAAQPGAPVAPTNAAARPGNATVSIDLLGVITDEQGRAVGRIRDEMRIPVAQAADLATRQLQYQSGVPLPAGHFKVKVAVRENTNGAMGTFEFPISIPDLKGDMLKVSPVVLSTQLRFARGGGPGGRGGRGGPGGPGGPGGGPQGRGGPGGGFGGPPINSARGGGGALFGDQSLNPLLKNGQEIVQSLTHVVQKNQTMYFYFEVYDPAVAPAGATTGTPKLKASLAFYRGRVKVFETPVVEKTVVDEPERKAAVFQLALSAADLKPGLYTCQINIIDEVTGRFAFPRIALYIKDVAK